MNKKQAQKYLDQHTDGNLHIWKGKGYIYFSCVNSNVPDSIYTNVWSAITYEDLDYAIKQYDRKKKVVCLKIKVPDSIHCWSGNVVCEHFSNEGGHGTCDLGIGFIKKDKYGHYLKPKKCLELKGE